MIPRLTRSETDRVIAGVAGGIAQRFDFSSTLVRLAWVASVLFGPFGILAYLVLWIALPKGRPQSSAIRIVEERYARDEISAPELERIRSDLQASHDGDSARSPGVGRRLGDRLGIDGRGLLDRTDRAGSRAMRADGKASCRGSAER
jgi:phage shock protein C